MTDEPSTEIMQTEPVVTNGNGAASVAPDLRTLQGLLREARANATTVHTVDVEIPGYQIDAPGYGTGSLYGTFRALDDYREARKIGKRHERVRDEATRELEIAAEMLVTSSVTTFLRIDKFGDVPLEMPLGAQLAQWLGLCEPGQDVNNSEAVFMIFPDTIKLAKVAADIDRLSQGASRDADVELAKN